MTAATAAQTSAVRDPRRNLAFEADMRILGHRSFEMEHGRYCLQSLNDMLTAWKAGARSAQRVTLKDLI